MSLQEPMPRIGLLARLVRLMRDADSWAGETHVQKSVYFLQKLFRVPLGFEFVLYRHGPYSFDLHRVLAQARALNAFGLADRPAPYGPSFEPLSLGKRLEDVYSEKITEYVHAIDWVVGSLSKKTVVELERIATALYVLDEDPARTDDQRAQRITELKPHIAKRQALEALKEVRGMLAEAKSPSEATRGTN